jgi:hypothetical protein
MAKEDLKKLLIQLFGDPALHDQVRKNGWEGLGFNLSPDEIDMLKRRDTEALRNYLQGDAVRMTNVAPWLPTKE